MSRALVHTYLGDRRGLLDAVQVRIVARMDTWVGHSLRRSTTPPGRLRAITGALFAFVEADREAWGVLVASGGLDHPALHGVRGRWCTQIAESGSANDLGIQAAVVALISGVGGWVNRGAEPDQVSDVLVSLLPT